MKPVSLRTQEILEFVLGFARDNYDANFDAGDEDENEKWEDFGRLWKRLERGEIKFMEE